jgi:heat shock protein HslJ
MRCIALLILPAVLVACAPQRAQFTQALSGKPPEVGGSLEGDWVVADLNGGGTPAGSFTLNFDGGDDNTSRLSGKSGCNRFTGRWQQSGRTLKLGPLGSTMMACEGPVMELEQRFLALLDAANAVSYTPRGEAVLQTADGRRLTLKRPPATPPAP